MKNWKIPLFKIYWDKDDIRHVNRIISSGMHWAEGGAIEEFEAKIGRYIGRRYCVVFNSGTSALHALLLAHGIGPMDEVIVPSFTFIATANAPLFVGAKPVFADIEEETLGLDPEDVKRKISPRTRAIIPIHYGGGPCRIEELTKIAKSRKLLLIEDAAEAFGARIKGKKMGTFGDSGILSFCQNKIINTGEGGAAVTDSKKLYERLKLIRSHGRSSASGYFSSAESTDYISLGYNFRMPSFVAALGIAQLAKVNAIIGMRRQNADYMTKKLRQIKHITTPGEKKDIFHVYQLYTVRIERFRDNLMKHLSSKGVMSKIYFPPVHLSRFYKDKFSQRPNLPVTERVSRKVLTLPMYPALKRENMDFIVNQIKTFIEME